MGSSSERESARNMKNERACFAVEKFDDEEEEVVGVFFLLIKCLLFTRKVFVVVSRPGEGEHIYVRMYICIRRGVKSKDGVKSKRERRE